MTKACYVDDGGEESVIIVSPRGSQVRWNFHTHSFDDLNTMICPDGALPDGPVCPRCGGKRAGMALGTGAIWAHAETMWIPR